MRIFKSSAGRLLAWLGFFGLIGAALYATHLSQRDRPVKVTGGSVVRVISAEVSRDFAREALMGAIANTQTADPKTSEALKKAAELPIPEGTFSFKVGQK